MACEAPWDLGCVTCWETWLSWRGGSFRLAVVEEKWHMGAARTPRRDGACLSSIMFWYNSLSVGDGSDAKGMCVWVCGCLLALCRGFLGWRFTDGKIFPTCGYLFSQENFSCDFSHSTAAFLISVTPSRPQLAVLDGSLKLEIKVRLRHRKDSQCSIQSQRSNSSSQEIRNAASVS